MTASSRPDAVASFIGDDPEQPRAWLGAGAEGRKSAVGLDETFLRGILRIRRGPGYQVSRSKRDLLVSVHDLLIGGRIPALGARKQLSVRWSALHRIASITPSAASWFRWRSGADCNQSACRCVLGSDGRRRAAVRADGARASA